MELNQHRCRSRPCVLSPFSQGADEERGGGGWVGSSSEGRSSTTRERFCDRPTDPNSPLHCPVQLHVYLRVALHPLEHDLARSKPLSSVDHGHLYAKEKRFVRNAENTSVISGWTFYQGMVSVACMRLFSKKKILRRVARSTSGRFCKGGTLSSTVPYSRACTFLRRNDVRMADGSAVCRGDVE